VKKNEKNELIYEMRKKNPTIAGVWSFILVGAGQIYNGQGGKGVLLLLSSMVLWIFWMGWTVWIYSIYDAYTTAKKKNDILALELDIPKIKL